MQELKERILRDGKNLGDGILKVDSFINHMVDPALMDACGREFARRFDVCRVVEKRQCVKRGVGKRRPHRADLPAGVVEEHGRADRAAPERVNTAAVEIVAVALLI